MKNARQKCGRGELIKAMKKKVELNLEIRKMSEMT